MEARTFIRVAIIVLAVLLLFTLVYNASAQTAPAPPMTAEKFATEVAAAGGVSPLGAAGAQKSGEPMANEPDGNEDYKAVDFEVKNQSPNQCYPKDRLTAEDLLPKDAANSRWAQVNPAGQGDVKDQNFLNAGYHVGIDTVGQSLRNASWDLRQEIPNPQTTVSPWMQTTIGPDTNKKSLC